MTTTGNHATAALVRAGETTEAITELRASVDRLLAGGALRSTPNTIRNAVALLDRLGRPDLAAPLVGWLAAEPVGIPGTPDMRRHPAELAQRLPDLLGEPRAKEAMALGARATIPEIVALTARALDEVEAERA